MEKELYPLKFEPILKKKLWGGNRLKNILQKENAGNNCGESWEISGVADDISIVSNGYLKGNSLRELIEIYMGDLVGDSVFDRYGLDFPLLVKFIDASDNLSIQVHPDDQLAAERHHSNGKTEMWYIMQAEENANLIVGFNRKIDKETYLKHLHNGTLNNILNYEGVKEGDVFFLPSGRIHAIGEGILLAEIQQTSDITYRIYDWERKDKNGKARELHNDLAADAIDYDKPDSYRTTYKKIKNKPENLVNCEYFITNILDIDKAIEKEYTLLDSFVIYICIEGKAEIQYEDSTESIKKGETVLIPSLINFITLKPKGEAHILEVYVK